MTTNMTPLGGAPIHDLKVRSMLKSIATFCTMAPLLFLPAAAAHEEPTKATFSLGGNAAWSQCSDIVSKAKENGLACMQAQEIDAMLLKYFSAKEPGATIVITRHGSILLRKSYGLADTATSQSLRPELSLRTGSLTKQFTAAAIMLLVEQGALSVTDEIEKFLPDYPRHGRHITIEQLLTHTSGIANYTELPTFSAVMRSDVSVEDAIAFFSKIPLRFQPGRRFSYSNSNYFLLGAIIEKVSGESYPEFMRQKIFLPLHMESTVIESSTSTPSMALGYTRGRKGMVSVPNYSMTWPFAAGALRTTVDDLVRWDSAIAAGLVLQRASWDRMAVNTTLPGGGRTGYGYGWFVRRFAGSDGLEHGGDISGFSAALWRFPTEEIFIAVLANSDSHEPAPDVVAEKIAKFLLRH